MDRIRHAAVNGSFYPADPQVIQQQIQSFMKDVSKATIPHSHGIVVPHAGYMFSGFTAAHAYAQLQDAYRVVIVLAPSHHVYLRKPAIFDGIAYETPLGQIPIHQEMMQFLVGRNIVAINNHAHIPEHSLEVQLPFLQTVLSDFSLVPIIMSGDSQQAQDLAEGLHQLLMKFGDKESILIVASTDLSHFHPAQRALKLDHVFIKSIENGEAEALEQAAASGRTEACGLGPVLTLLHLAQKEQWNGRKVLHYSHSGMITGNDQEVVGYLAAAFYQQDADTFQEKKSKNNHKNNPFSSTEQQAMLAFVRQTIEARLQRNALPQFPLTDSKFDAKTGLFVTLHLHGNLRGCIGFIEGVEPLKEALSQMALSAAFQDPRFSPLTASELPMIDIEISILSPLELTKDVDDIEIGVHGLLIRKGYSSGLLLPQVATEYQWNREEFLQHTCRKAGLPANAWQEADTQIWRFSATIFGEKA